VSCSQIVDIEDFVLGTIDDERAAELRAHVLVCDACSDEAELVKAERALFEDRESVMIGPPPELAAAIREQRASASAPVAVRVAAQVVQLFRRGHFSAACAAALFIVASMSRLGGGGLTGMSGTPTASRPIDGESEASGILASMSRDEPLACSPGSAPMTVNDDTMSSSAFASLGHETQAQVLACTPLGSRAACESSSSVTCATFRQ
jgi:hypothetical protein